MSAESFWWWTGMLEEQPLVRRGQGCPVADTAGSSCPPQGTAEALRQDDGIYGNVYLGKGRIHCMERGGWNNREWKIAEGIPRLEKRERRWSKQWSRDSPAAQEGDHAGADFSWQELHKKPIQEQIFFQKETADCGNSPWQSRGKVQGGRRSRETSMYWPWPSIIPLMPFGGRHAVEKVGGKELSLGKGW